MNIYLTFSSFIVTKSLVPKSGLNGFYCEIVLRINTYLMSTFGGENSHKVRDRHLLKYGKVIQ